MAPSVLVCTCIKSYSVKPPLSTLRRKEFESSLTEFTNQVEEFTKKEVPRTLDEIRPVVETLDKLGSELEDAKNKAMVSQRSYYLNS